MNSNSNIGIPVVMSDYRIGISGCDVGMVTCNSIEQQLAAQIDICYTLSRSRDSPSSVTVLRVVGLRQVHLSLLLVIMIILFTHPSPNSVSPTFHVSDLRFVSCFRSYSHFPFCSIFDPRP